MLVRRITEKSQKDYVNQGTASRIYAEKSALMFSYHIKPAYGRIFGIHPNKRKLFSH